MMMYFSFLAVLTIMFLICFLMTLTWVIEFSIVSLGNLSFNLSFLLDKESSVFSMTVSMIFMMIYLYTFSYMSEEIFLKRFIWILFLFVSSMWVLILSGNLFNSLIGWDGLGVTSLFLILFYYSNSSLKAGTLTFLMNRVGDCFFILTLTSILLMSENQIYYTSSIYSTVTSILLMITSISKSAQIPFSTWLPAAMEAPTPVSSLVHSSTLVTAGVFLLYRYKEVWLSSSLSKELLLILSVSTCFMAGLSALVESDLKKLIALSTLSQLGFIMFSFSLGLLSQGFLHMLMHAYFKALLFMCAGLMIHSYKSTQSILMMNISEKQNPLLVIIMGSSLMSMMGLPFMAGFYSKDFILDSLKSTNLSVFIFITLIASLVCTVMYSVRMVWYLMSSSMSWHCMSEGDYSMIKPMMPLAMMSCLGGSLTSWLMVDVQIYFDTSKMGLLVLLGVVIVSYWIINNISTSDYLESKWNLMVFNPILSSSFFSFASKYQDSSDLMGVPEILNKSLKKSLLSMTAQVELSMVQYSGNLELLMFLVGLFLVFM